jgi:hypothetical protein
MVLYRNDIHISLKSEKENLYHDDGLIIYKQQLSILEKVPVAVVAVVAGVPNVKPKAGVVEVVVMVMMADAEETVAEPNGVVPVGR